MMDETNIASGALSQPRNATDNAVAILHDLRTPLAAIMCSAETLEQFRELNEKQINELFRTMRMASRRVKDILDSFELGPAQMRCAKEIDLRNLIENICREFPPDEQRRLILRVADMEFHVLGRDDHLARAIINIVSNGLKYSPRTEPVTVWLIRDSVAQCRVKIGIIAVVDHGPGISPADMPHIFEWGFRGGDKKARAGCGLGLYICKRFVDAHGGRLEVTSSAQGSTFCVMLPLV